MPTDQVARPVPAARTRTRGGVPPAGGGPRAARKELRSSPAPDGSSTLLVPFVGAPDR